LTLSLVGTARCAVRAASSGAIHRATTDVRSARCCAGGDIAARCPYLSQGQCQDAPPLTERTLEACCPKANEGRARHSVRAVLFENHAIRYWILPRRRARSGHVLIGWVTDYPHRIGDTFLAYMPWKTNSDREQRWGFVQLAMRAKMCLAELCRRSGISRKTAYKWIARFEERGRRGLRDEARSAH